ncbi:MAG: hypothetical protein MI741_10325, partial [Rhodospirillales bacterium]|nr:hypothetical protein [Rhodospirillales bacterium]
MNRSEDVFIGGEGEDTLQMTDGDDALFLDDGFSDSPTDGPRISGIENIDAGAGDDVVDLTSTRYETDDITIDGGSGDDVIWSSSGDDDLLGGTGDDEIFGGAGDDTIDGGAGIDTAVFTGSFADYAISIDTVTGVITVAGPDGTDTLTNIENLRFDDGVVPVDTLGGEPEISVTPAQGDEDQPITLNITVAAGSPFDPVGAVTIGGVPAGAALAVGTDSGLTLTGNVLTGSGEDGQFTADDLQALADGALTVQAPTNSDVDFSVSVSAESASGAASDPVSLGVTVDAVADAPDVTVTVGDPTVVDQTPEDLDTDLGIEVDVAAPTMPDQFDHTGTGGDDEISGEWGDDSISGAGGDDELHGDYSWQTSAQGDDQIDGGSGDDEITGGGGSDQIVGGTGDDVIDGDFSWKTSDAGSDVIDAGSGDDEVIGGGGDDQIAGGEGDDYIEGDYDSPSRNAGDDVIDAGAGDDTVIGGDGDDTIAGGEGDDYIEGDFDWQTHGGDDRILAGAGDDTVIGGKGDDTIAGGAGDDTIYADLEWTTHHDGDDTVAGGAGDDTIYGGRGDDVAVYAGTRDQYQITQNQDGSFTITDTVAGRDGTDTVHDVETFRFSDGDVAAADLLSGEGGGEDGGGYTIEFPLDIAANLTDTDGSESLSDITISGVPDGASLSAGTDNGDG